MADGALILVVDDDQDIRETIEIILADEGYAVATAGDGKQALALLQREAPIPQMILLDLMMPVMSGWELCAVLRDDRRLNGIPVVLMSGNPIVKDAAVSLGAAAWASKPVSLGDLLELSRRFCVQGAG